MLVYRIGRTKYARDLTGEGARLNGGRWNHIMTRCLYASESRALALLEFTVNMDIDEIPRALSFTTLEVPDNSILTVKEAQLPGDWKKTPAPFSTRDFGTGLLEAAKSLVIKIPSIVVPEEWNYLINHVHPDIKQCKIVDVNDTVYDIRIKG
jgi:RES domain-containing protein